MRLRTGPREAERNPLPWTMRTQYSRCRIASFRNRVTAERATASVIWCRSISERMLYCPDRNPRSATPLALPLRLVRIAAAPVPGAAWSEWLPPHLASGARGRLRCETDPCHLARQLRAAGASLVVGLALASLEWLWNSKDGGKNRRWHDVLRLTSNAPDSVLNPCAFRGAATADHIQHRR